MQDSLRGGVAAGEMKRGWVINCRCIRCRPPPPLVFFPKPGGFRILLPRPGIFVSIALEPIPAVRETCITHTHACLLACSWIGLSCRLGTCCRLLYPSLLLPCALSLPAAAAVCSIPPCCCRVLYPSLLLPCAPAADFFPPISRLRVCALGTRRVSLPPAQSRFCPLSLRTFALGGTVSWSSARAA